MPTSTVRSTSALDARLTSNSGVALGIFRILVGLMFAMHGTAKLFAFPSGTPVAFGTWPAWWAGVLEIVLGLLITVGLVTRVAAFVASGMMAVAYFWRHFPDGFWPIDNGGESAVLYCFIFLLLVFIGPGSLAVSRR
ncbi:DoxX family protein [Mycobacterium frederiksbergense]|uniref:DoxX family protein n=1 Tax=Mycolicibacterium frederiksbergense TaxID=117567 RepID=A0A6H0S6P1_9MYCO|nr:DoxX family protein [Mycolicibacterium frederiksbergense]MCV7045262.1 DoxX family protein [Mycolicibacterium frederiksbergense]QIV83018.1 DoxX family protein [Mycolicibacterium frederiksbergense]